MPTAPPPTAPSPPAGWDMPEGYVALRCQFCMHWSTMPSPYTTARATRCKFWPLIPWYQGTRDAPKGAICLVCVGVPLTSNADKDNADNAVHYVVFEYYYSLRLYKSLY